MEPEETFANWTNSTDQITDEPGPSKPLKITNNEDKASPLQTKSFYDAIDDGPTASGNLLPNLLSFRKDTTNAEPTTSAFLLNESNANLAEENLDGSEFLIKAGRRKKKSYTRLVSSKKSPPSRIPREETVGHLDSLSSFWEESRKKKPAASESFEMLSDMESTITSDSTLEFFRAKYEQAKCLNLENEFSYNFEEFDLSEFATASPFSELTLKCLKRRDIFDTSSFNSKMSKSELFTALTYNITVSNANMEKAFKLVVNLLLFMINPQSLIAFKDKLNKLVIESFTYKTRDKVLSNFFFSVEKLIKPYSKTVSNANLLCIILRKLGNLALQENKHDFLKLLETLPTRISSQKDLNEIKELLNKVSGTYRRRDKLIKSDQVEPFLSKKIESLKKIQMEIFDIEKKFYEEVYALKYRCFFEFSEIYKERQSIIVGGQDVERSEEEIIEDSVKGIPNFWFTILKNVSIVRNLIEDYDEPILDHLKNIRYEMEMPSKMGFTLYFEFDENEFFANTTLTKEYYIKNDSLSKNKLLYQGPEIYKCVGCRILWNPGKNVTLKDRCSPSYIYRCLRDSFFNFFAPPEIKEGDTLDDDTCEVLINHFKIGHLFQERIIPRALSLYTGEAFDDNFHRANEKLTFLIQNPEFLPQQLKPQLEINSLSKLQLSIMS